MSSSVAAALADGSGDYDSSDERRGISIGALEPQSMEVDDDDDDDDDSKDDEDEQRRMLASAMRRDYIGGEDEGSDSESSSLGPPVVTNLQDHLLGLIRRLDELNALDAARDAERTARVAAGAGGEPAPSVPSTSRRRPDTLRSRSSAAAYGARPGDGESSSSTTRDDEPEAAAWGAHTSMLGMGYEYADPRVIPISPSTYLRPGSRFHGTQQSERQRYDVQVEIKHVDLRESFLCGYLRIQGKAHQHLIIPPARITILTRLNLSGLTEDHPTLTTYFEGEIIGTKYGFNTQHPSWGASDKTDLSHWAKFQAFRPFQKQMKKGGGGGSVVIKDVANRENIFMRWKEHFLVPDHRVRTIHGASFEGFYYICFNQLRGEVSGIYFHSKSEK